MTKIERESINFKLPKPLTAALRAKARQLNTTATDFVIQGLHHVLGTAQKMFCNSPLIMHALVDVVCQTYHSIGEPRINHC